MCNDRSWKSCSIATIVFTSMLMLGMFIAIGVMNSMFGDNMQCYVDADKSHRNHDHWRQMFEGMDKIAAQHPSIAKTFGSAVKQLPAFRSFAPEGRKLQSEDGYCAKRYVSCNTDSNGCSCKDGTSGWPENDDGTTSWDYYCSASTDGLCYDNSVDNPSDTSTMCAPTEELGLGLGSGGIARHRWAIERVPTAIHPPSANGHPQLTGAFRATIKTLASRSTAAA